MRDPPASRTTRDPISVMPPLTLDAAELARLLIRLGIALLLALPIGYERERSARSAGLRTFPLVAVAACAFILMALRAVGTAPDAQARILQGLMTGIGFIGGGAILKDRLRVTGTATAASLWATSAIGAASAYGQLELALLLSVLTIVLLRGLHAIERRIRGGENPDQS